MWQSERLCWIVVILGSVFRPVSVESAALFIRADANADGAVDISDAIGTMGFLFLGNTEITCQDAADANDDGALDISDPINTLTFLFRGAVGIPGSGTAPSCSIKAIQWDEIALPSRWLTLTRTARWMYARQTLRLEALLIDSAVDCRYAASTGGHRQTTDRPGDPGSGRDLE